MRFAVLPVFLLLLGVGTATADDFFLTIGGGYSRTGNQVSLERNVVFQQNVLARVRTDRPTHEIYFADGDNPGADLQYRDPDYKTNIPKAERLLREFLEGPGDADIRYRDHVIENQTGPAERDVLANRFHSLGKQLKSGDRLFVYVTAHGGSGKKKQAKKPAEKDQAKQADEKAEEPVNEHNTRLYLWQRKSVSAEGFSHWLDELPTDVQVFLVMVQCYSGGFAHTIFTDNDAANGLSDFQRCGFYSQLHDRPSAGCTPDVDEADYQEYSSFFWAALGGETRDGRPIESADYDSDGEISFAEAHAYAVIESDTIDIPIRTTGEFLRKYSTLPKLAESVDLAPEPGLKQLLTLSGSIAELAQLGRADQRAILMTLPEQIGLTTRATIEELRDRIKRIDNEYRSARGRYARAESRYSRSAKRMEERIKEEWPGLDSMKSDVAKQLLAESAEEFVQRVEELTGFKYYNESKAEAEKLADAYSSKNHLRAKSRRLLRTCENIVLAANLADVADEATVARFEALLSMEESRLSP